MGSLSASSKRRITADDISTLKSLLSATSATLLTPQDQEYPASISRWSRAAEKPAGLVLAPSTADEVAIAVKYATEQGLDLAVKCGGHSTAGVSSTEGGLLIDLHAKMRGVEVDVERKLFRAQGGANWGDVDQAGVKHNLATVGGTVSDTGVGGLTLGGGYGWLSGQRGLVIDNLVEATVVLANGEIKKASKDENPDLFWALAGAGQNFGVAVEFVLKAYDQGEVFAGMLLFPPTPEIVDKVVAATNELYTADANGKTRVNGRGTGGFGVAKPPPAGGQVMILVVVIYFGTAAEAKEVFKPYFDIGPVADTTSMVPFPVTNTLLAPPIGLRASMKGAAFSMPIRPAFVNDVLSEYVKFTSSNDDLGISLVLWEMFDPYHVATLENGCYANRGWHLNSLICPIWTKEENDPSCRQWARDLNEMFKKELETRANVETGNDAAVPRGKKGAVQLYGNYDHYDERARDIFGDNYPRLQSLKAKYDPTNMFNKLFPITPQA